MFITPWMKPTSSQRATRSAWRATTASSSARYGVRPRGLRVVAGDHVVRQQPHRLEVAPRGEVLEGADADVAGGDARQHGAGQRRLADDLFAGRHRGQRAGRRDAERGHGLAHDVLAQHRSERGAAVAAARKGRRPGALELDVAAYAVAIHHLAEQNGAAVA